MPPMAKAQKNEEIAAALMPSLDAFVNFVRERGCDPELAADGRGQVVSGYAVG